MVEELKTPDLESSYAFYEILNFLNKRELLKMQILSKTLYRIVPQVFPQNCLFLQQSTLIMFPGDKIYTIGKDKTMLKASGDIDDNLRSISSSSDSSSNTEDSDD
jgi:hypothetical protein